MSFKITPDGGDPFVVTESSRDVLTWERTNRSKKILADLQSRVSMEDMYRVAWIAARRLGLIPAGLELREFEETHEIEQVPEDDDTAVDPTQPGPSTGTSSPSP